MNGTPVPILSTHAAANGSISPNAASTPVTVEQASLQLGSLSSRRTSRVFIKYWSKPIAATLVYSVTLYIAASAPFRYTVLGRVSAPLGTWILNLLSKFGDILFSFAVADAVDTLTWRKLKERQAIVRGTREKFFGIKLEWFLALMSSTGVEGLFRILKKSLRVGCLRHTAGRWAFIRLILIMALIPGPGIILMANVRQRVVFFPVTSMDVSGGLADYDPQTASYSTVLGPTISRYIETMLSDRSIAWPLEPVSEDCQKEKSCVSYLIAGAYQTIAPWPFTLEDEDMDSYRLYNAPYYQVDLWYTSPDITFSESRDCMLYGGLHRDYEQSFILCISQQSSSGPLAAGWASCQLGYAQNYTCLYPAKGAKDGWTTYLRFYRRSATTTFSRSSYTIQEVTNLSLPIAYNITPTNLFASINHGLYRPKKSTNDPRYDSRSFQYILTQHIGSTLWVSLNERARGLNLGKDYLRNLLTFPVYLFQPTMAAFATNLPPIDQMNGTLVAPNLPPENYLKGSYCVADERSIPAWETVLAYAIVAGMVLSFVWLLKLSGTLLDPIETSEFPMIDFAVLTTLYKDGNRTEEEPLRERFDSYGYEQRNLLDKIADLNVSMRDL
ncbi:hypothetical protein CC78DRAFT_611923 [Lojkania enalia]|uniref:Uncharacterized protein n=1 Tax=Lojkania enalia TaxID=147567 RepID=A0A9P4NBN4_9PLEO|nr:hypothetical protein CC78DRAFT_611923 [Didymosphaeria enalia]